MLLHHGWAHAAPPTNPPLPADFGAKDVPFGIGLTGRPFQERRLLGIAYAFEKATQHRVRPAFDTLTEEEVSGLDEDVDEDTGDDSDG